MLLVYKYGQEKLTGYIKSKKGVKKSIMTKKGVLVLSIIAVTVILLVTGLVYILFKHKYQDKTHEKKYTSNTNNLEADPIDVYEHNPVVESNSFNDNQRIIDENIIPKNFIVKNNKLIMLGEDLENEDEAQVETDPAEMTDEDKIKQLLENLFATNLKYYQGIEADYSEYFTKSHTSNDAKYYIDRQILTKAIYSKAKIKIDSMDMEITFNNVSINESNADVELYEFFSFMYSERNGLPSSQGIIYNITLIKENSEWKIETIVSNDEFDGQFYKIGFDLDEQLKYLQ